jgi:tRNA uridine 5-carboxymethylaminomethyl modification enzyme
VVLTTGTFLRGKIHTGTSISEGGRHNEKAANALSGSLEELGIPIGRLKTGTPARIHADSIDYSLCDIQPGDEPPRPFSFQTGSVEGTQIPCYTVHSTAETTRIVAEALPEAPIKSGQIEGVGPRYCPSFELKVDRFPDRDQHLLHLEPEGRHTKEVYINGMSTSLAPTVQEAMIRSIPALREAVILRYGYAVEYDYVPPRVLRHSLEVRDVAGLFHAGQLNGTSGYEEAAAQGLIAGANAALSVQGREPFVLDRSQAYIGVLIDDLVTKGTDEPYRLFTSRAEYRLLLRSDNADLRLTPLAADVGLVEASRGEFVDELQEEIDSLQEHCRQTHHEGASLEKLLRQPERTVEEVAALEPQGRIAGASARAREQLKVQAKYAGYIERQLADIERYRRAKAQRIPDDFDYTVLDGLRCEAKEKFMRFRPADLEDAGRISGVSPADVAILSVHLKRAQSTAD